MENKQTPRHPALIEVASAIRRALHARVDPNMTIHDAARLGAYLTTALDLVDGRCTVTQTTAKIATPADLHLADEKGAQ